MTNRITDIPGLSHLWVLDNLYLAGQPAAESWEVLSQRGVKKIINIRSESEKDFAEDKVKVESLGMEYVQIPVMLEGKLSSKACQNISEHINEKDTIMIHCGSANRVAGWLMVHLTRKGMEFEKAVKIAQENGLANPGFIEQAEDIVS